MKQRGWDTGELNYNAITGTALGEAVSKIGILSVLSDYCMSVASRNHYYMMPATAVSVQLPDAQVYYHKYVENFHRTSIGPVSLTDSCLTRKKPSQSFYSVG